MKKLVCLAGLILFCFTTAFAQLTPSEEKTVEKAKKSANKGEFDKAVEILKPVLVKHQDNTELWNTIVNYKYKAYQMSRNSGLGDFTIKVSGDSTGKDSLANKLADMLNGMDLKKMSFSQFVTLCKEGERLCEFPEYPNIYLRNFFVDKPGFENLPDKAIKFYNKAEDAFGEKNYDDAKKYYAKAIEEYPKFYKAVLYLGDTYFITKDYGTAAKYYRQASAIQPDQLEPHKYLFDALREMNNDEEAMNEAISTIMIYPDGSMFWKIEDLATTMNKKFDRNWMPRKVPVNILKDSFNFKESIFTDESGKSTTSGKVEEPWNYYQEAWEKIKPYTNEKGIVKSDNPLTKQRYAETYCWEYMLEKSNDESLNFARKMQKQNTLDCYVLVSLYSYDLYPQLQDLIQRNPDKVKTFLKSLLVSR
jgi:tetratricopeptide (TPR) repeat protein